jgi:hypothetical protein
MKPPKHNPDAAFEVGGYGGGQVPEWAAGFERRLRT